MSETHDATRRKLVITSTAGVGLLLVAGKAGPTLAADKGGKGKEKPVGG